MYTNNLRKMKVNNISKIWELHHWHRYQDLHGIKLLSANVCVNHMERTKQKKEEEWKKEDVARESSKR